jgi:hypothetical protein
MDRMTKKRFNSYCDNENIRIRIDDDIKNKEVFHIYFAELDDAIYCKSKLNPILDLLNELHEENQSYKQNVSKTLQKHYNRLGELSNNEGEDECGFMAFIKFLSQELDVKLEELE